jgi:hypothetical protein
MAASHFSFRAGTRWLLVSVLSGVVPATGADALPKALPGIVRGSALECAVAQPGTPAIQDNTPQAVVQRPADQIPATAAPAKRHRSPWVWVAVVAGIAVGAGAAIVLGNHQPIKTSASIPGVTVTVGGPSPGAPHP